MDEPTQKSVFFLPIIFDRQPILIQWGLDGTIFCLIDESNKRGGPGPSHEGVNMEVTDFDYDLPKELIAQTPIEPRDASRLLVMDKKTGALEHRHFYNLPEYLRPGDVLVFNDTRVMPARLHGTKTTGAHVEVFLLTRKNNTDWEVLVKPGKKLQEGAEIIFSDELSCTILEKTDFGGRVARFRFDGVFEEILDRLGETPLPPYIHEKLKDKERYQTVYNRELGSAAASTAGLHFTKELMQKIKEMGVEEVL